MCTGERERKKERGERDKLFNFLVVWKIKEAGLILPAAVCCVVCGNDE